MVSFTGVRMHQSEDTNVKFMLELTLPQMPPHNCKFYMYNRQLCVPVVLSVCIVHNNASGRYRVAQHSDT